MKASRSKKEYMGVMNKREDGGMVRLLEVETMKVGKFKYLELTIKSKGENGRDMKKKMQARWTCWRRVTGMACNRRICARMKVYRMDVRSVVFIV